MVEIEITRLSSKGQVVIPIQMRKGFKEGEKLMIIKADDKIIIKRASEMDEKFKEDIEFARRTDEARKKIESGKGITMNFDDFLNEMKKW